MDIELPGRIEKVLAEMERIVKFQYDRRDNMGTAVKKLETQRGLVVGIALTVEQLREFQQRVEKIQEMSSRIELSYVLREFAAHLSREVAALLRPRTERKDPSLASKRSY